MPPKPSVCTFLGNIPCIQIHRQCTGIKACESLDQRLRNTEHKEVDSGHWTLINQLRSEYSTNMKKIKALNFVQAAIDLWKEGSPCFQPTQDCTLIVVESYHIRSIL